MCKRGTDVSLGKNKLPIMSYTSENEDEEFFDASDMTPYPNDAKRHKKSINSSNVEEAIEKDGLEPKEVRDGLPRKLDCDDDLNSTATGWRELHHSDETLECKAKKSVVIHEPDIIQSTKSGSLPRQQLPVPMVPPRKKKARSADVPLPSLLDEKVITPNDELHVSLVDPESDDLPHAPRMPECTSPMLDISSATKGICLVSLCEQETVCEQENTTESFHSTKDDDDSSYDDPPPHEEEEEEEEAICKDVRDYGTPLSEDVLNQRVPVGTRPRTISGSRFMTDKEILEQVFVLNLDTGETVPLSSAEEKIPKCINPLSLHIMRRTKEYLSSDSNLHKGECSDNESLKEIPNETKKSKSSTGRKRMKIKQFIGKTVHKIKAVTEKASHADDTSTDDDEASENRKAIKIKTSHSHKGPYDFDLLVPIQEIGDNKSGAVWTMKFSHCGRLLATGGQDGVLRVWVVRDAFSFFNELRIKYNDASSSAAGKATSSMATPCDGQNIQAEDFEQGSDDYDPESAHMPFQKRPFCSYTGHTADVLDVSWSKNYFLLSSSMDKTVRLWHISRRECLCCFQHIDFVTAISFHPKDDRYFLSGSLDGKLRLWNIPDKKVALWNEVSGPTKLITAANFCLNGRFAVVGTYDGRCIFYNSEQLKYFTQIHVRSTRGKNARGRKITGVEPLHGEDKILVTSNDSRIRLYDLRDLTLTCKYKGVANNSSQIKASFSHDGRYVVCGSEDQFVYIWRTQHEFYKFSSARRDRNDYWEGIKAHSAVVTNAIFAPNPRAIIKPQFEFVDLEDKDNMKGGQGEVLVSADYLGSIRVFINKFKPSP